MRNYIVSPAAQSDLAEIADFLRRNAGARTAMKVVGELRGAILKIAAMPGIGHPRAEFGDETLRFHRVYRYLIIYRPDSRPLEIVRVLHGARDLGAILSG